MKQTLIYFLLLISTTIVAQNAVAELKFEEAETAFNNGNYELTLQKVDEFEKTLGSMTDKSLYLRVVSQNKLFVPANFHTDEKQFVLYNSLTINAKKYIKATERNGLDDKFKEIYAISENLKKLNLPKDKVVWQKEKQRIEKAEQEKVEQQAQLDKLYREVVPIVDDWEWAEYIKIGANYKELKKKYPEEYEALLPFTQHNKKQKKTKTNTFPYISSVAHPNNSIYHYTIALGNFDNEQAMKEFVTKEVAKLKSKFGENCFTETKTETSSNYSTPTLYANCIITLTVSASSGRYFVILQKQKIDKP